MLKLSATYPKLRSASAAMICGPESLQGPTHRRPETTDSGWPSSTFTALIASKKHRVVGQPLVVLAGAGQKIEIEPLVGKSIRVVPPHPRLPLCVAAVEPDVESSQPLLAVKDCCGALTCCDLLHWSVRLVLLVVIGDEVVEGELRALRPETDLPEQKRSSRVPRIRLSNSAQIWLVSQTNSRWMAGSTYSLLWTPWSTLATGTAGRNTSETPPR